MEKEWIRKSGDTRRKIVSKFKNMFVSDIETNNGQVSSIASIKSTTETQERVANFKEGGDQRQPNMELSDQDKMANKVCMKIFWCTLIFWLISIPIIGIFELDICYAAILFCANIIALPISSFCYWRFIRKEPIPDWFYVSNDDSNQDWNSGYKTSEYKSFATNPIYSSSPSNTFYRI